MTDPSPEPRASLDGDPGLLDTEMVFRPQVQCYHDGTEDGHLWDSAACPTFVEQPQQRRETAPEDYFDTPPQTAPVPGSAEDPLGPVREIVTDPDLQLPDAEATDYPLPPLEAGQIGIELDCPLPEGVPDLATFLWEGNPSEAEHYMNAYDVRLEPVSDVGPNGVPSVRMSGFHEDVRNALTQYLGGNEELAASAYHVAVTAVGTGSVVGGVEARLDSRGINPPEFRPNTETFSDSEPSPEPLPHTEE